MVLIFAMHGSTSGATVLGGNDPIARTFVDGFTNFTLLDRNHPISANGTVTAWEIWEIYPNLGAIDPLQLVIFRQTGPTSFDIVGISELKTPTEFGVNTFSLPSPIAVQAGHLVGLRYAGRASVPFDLDPPSFSFSRGDFNGTMLFTDNNSGLTNSFVGSFDRTYSIRVIGEAVLNVAIDIKPGSFPNSINLGSAGVVRTARG